MSGLKELWLTNMQIDDAGLAHLVELKQLQSMTLFQTSFTAGQVNKLRQALPNTKITSTSNSNIKGF